MKTIGTAADNASASMTSAGPAAASRRYPVARLRADFPSLSSGYAFFDAPGGTQTPRQVGEAIHATITGPLSNRGHGAPSQANADAAVSAFRLAIADLLDAEPAGVVHGRSATELTYEVSRALAKGWHEGDEVVVSRLDHDANVRPWVQAAERAGARVRWIDFDPDTAELTLEHVRPLLGDRTKVVALTAASNLLGTMPPVRSIADLAHEAGALVYVDGVHAAAHAALSLPRLGADFLVCSPYKFLGPHCGVLAASPELLRSLRPDKLLPATDAVPERFEHGTLPYETLAGVTAAVDYLAGISAEVRVGASPGAAGHTAPDTANSVEPRAGRDTRSGRVTEANRESGAADTRRARLEASFALTAAHEDRLRTRIEDAIGGMPGVRSWSRAERRTPTLLLTFEQRTADEAFQHLLSSQVLAPAGSFYALEPARRLGLGEAGGLRIGLAPYNDDEDVERLLEGLKAFVGA